MFKNVNISVLLWAGIAILILAAIYAPISRPDIPDETTDVFRMDAFSPLVTRVDEQLRHGEDLEISPQELSVMRPILQSRRLINTGPMAAHELTEAVEIFREYRPQIDSQEAEGSKQAVRAYRNRKLTEAFPRLDEEKITEELTRFHQEYEFATKAPPHSPH
ncbi:MAG: hypothetical protein ACNA8W_09420 [Bradymonadaceae bacterium]